MKTTLVNAYEGIGDSIYARPFIEQLVNDGDEVYVKTVLPEMFADLQVKLIDPEGARYRTQLKSYSKTQVEYAEVVPQTFNRTLFYRYGPKELKRHSIFGVFERMFGYDVGSLRPRMTLPATLPAHGLTLPRDKRIALVRPPTVRTEFRVETKHPEPSYVSWCARMLREAGYYVISLADCQENHEELLGESPPADLHLHSGELGIFGTLSLFKEASVVVTGPGFALPAALAADVPLFVIFGGRGAYDNPHKLFDLRMNLKRVGWALPRSFCRCDQQVHTCDKEIPDLDSQFFNFMRML